MWSHPAEDALVDLAGCIHDHHGRCGFHAPTSLLLQFGHSVVVLILVRIERLAGPRVHVMGDLKQ